MQLFNENDIMKLTETARQKHLADQVIIGEYNAHIHEKLHRVRTFYSHPWCSQVSHDYCPLVISLMSFICLISIILIVYICVRGTIQCNPLKKFIRTIKQKLCGRNRLNTSARLSYDRSTLPTANAMDLSSPINRSFFTTVNNFTHSSPDREGQIWFTDINKSTVPKPPPTYEESQTYTIRNLIKPVPINPVIKAYPIVQKPITTATENTTFTITETEPTTEPSSTTVFPSYRCVTLTSSPNTRASLNRLGDLSRQLLEENTFAHDLEFNRFSRMGSLNIHNDEVPPAYDAIIGNVVSQNGPVIGTFEGNQQYISSEYLV